MLLRASSSSTSASPSPSPSPSPSRSPSRSPSLSPSASPHPKVLIITGPTGVGKSSTALALCRALDGEIISADSVQLYRGLDIASNKPPSSHRALTPHHLLDIADPGGDAFTAGDFFRAARAALAAVLARRRVPVVVGGTMMYVRWLMRGRPATPPPPPAARARVDRALRAVRPDWQAGLALLRARDPRRADVLSPNDWYRLARALEVVETTGVAMTEMPLKGGAPGVTGPAQGDGDYDFRCVFLYADRVALNRRIDKRCEEMLLPAEGGDGVLEEVSRLLRTRGMRVEATAPSRAIGYRQTIQYLVGRALVNAKEEVTVVSEAEAEAAAATAPAPAAPAAPAAATQAFREFVEDFQAATRGYAKQQISWYRKEPHFHWVEAGADAVDKIQSLLALDGAEFEAFTAASAAEQARVREEMIAQGRLMKTYVAEKGRLGHGGAGEAEGVRRAERCAAELRRALPREELERMLRVVARGGGDNGRT